MTRRGADVAPDAARMRTPGLARRMACFVYEAMLLFGLGLIPGVVGALFFAQTGQHDALQSETTLRVFAWIFYGIYFVWFWSTRGRTLAMQTWHIRLVDVSGQPVSQGRALIRYVACSAAWFGPATLASRLLHLGPLPSLGLIAAGVIVYALLALTEPSRQFWHDRMCATRLVDARGSEADAALRRRPR